VALLGLGWLYYLTDEQVWPKSTADRPSPTFGTGIDAVRWPKQIKQATALAPGTVDLAVKVGQLTGDTLPQIVETTHELGESAGGADG
jgi:hypothetical protein